MTDELPRLLNEQHCYSLIEALYIIEALYNAQLMEQHELDHIGPRRRVYASLGKPNKMQ